MSLENSDFKDRKPQLINFQEKLINVPLNIIDKYFILCDTQMLNDDKILNTNYRMILVRLIYSINQGILFSDEEIELLFFRVTKLLLSNDSVLRKLTYKSLKVLIFYFKMLNPQMYSLIIVQSLIKDIMHQNELIKIEALKFISMIQEESHIELLAKFIQKSIVDNNCQVSTTALIVGINIFVKFPQIVQQWQPEIQSKLIYLGQINYHSLILLQQIRKNDQIKFHELIKFPSQPQQQLVNLLKQLLKIKKEILSFLKYSIMENQNLLFLESFQSLILKQDIQNIDFEPIIKQFKKIFSQTYDVVQIYSAVNKIHFFVKEFSCFKSKIQELKRQIEIMTQSNEISISYISMLTCMHFQQSNLEAYIAHLFKFQNITDIQFNIVEGLVELIQQHPYYCQSISQTFRQHIVNKSSNKILKVMTLRMFTQILCANNWRDYQIVLQTLFKISSPKEQKFKLSVVQLVGTFFDIPIENFQQSIMHPCFQYLEKEFQNCPEDFIRTSSVRHQEIRQKLLSIIENDKKVRLQEQQLKSYKHLDQICENNLDAQVMEECTQIYPLSLGQNGRKGSSSQQS